ncbi:hypothetical protein [Rodentibacter rarus]|uniref:hypothetical protein n=1 Tax=Rodentibacter rarus TaxID=1908260 RepID=UPI000987596D|nr:hypothetical protein [Rodentibacter rarus]
MKNQELYAFMKANKMTQKQVATLFDTSLTTVNQYLNDKYPTDTKWLDEKVDELLARQKAKVVEAKYNNAFVPTMTAKRGIEIMQFAHAEGEINVIYGAAGLGKTQMLTRYQGEHSEPDPMLERIGGNIYDPTNGASVPFEVETKHES